MGSKWTKLLEQCAVLHVCLLRPHFLSALKMFLLPGFALITWHYFT
jgi:hypothetical protein